MADVLVRENVTSMVPAAPPDPSRAICSWDGWHPAAATAGLAGTVGVEVTVRVAAGAVVGACAVDVPELDALVPHALSADTALSAASANAPARAVIRMPVLLLIPD
jgi:hypothetical protein